MSIPEKWIRASGDAVLSWPDRNQGSREECVHKDLTRRLKGVCENLSSVDFESLVVKMTDEQLRVNASLIVGSARADKECS